MKTKKFYINTLLATLLSLVVSCNMLPDERLFDEPTDIPDTLSVSGEIDGHDYVDLGLPSGTLWASCNVGALYPEEYGGYYAWGETEEKSDYDWSTYKWCNGSSTSMTKYCNNSYYGTVDNKITLDPEDDVAHVKWGGNWRMPTKAELDELRNNCTRMWTTLNGVYGQKVTSKINGNSIFMPAAGSRYGADLYDSGSGDYYWLSSLHEYDSNCAYLNSSFNYRYNRYSGHSVRPVIGAATTVRVSSSQGGTASFKEGSEESASVSCGAWVTIVATPDTGYRFLGWAVRGSEDVIVSTEPEYTYKVEHDVELVALFDEDLEVDGYDCVNLGLPSGTLWATYNVGAQTPYEYGGYYAWGETEEKGYYEWGNYKWCKGSKETMTKYCDDSYGTVDNKTVLDPEDDVAHVKWGGSWRMPAKKEFKELYSNCTIQWTEQNGVVGAWLISKTNGNRIFLPSAGYCSGTELHERREDAYYWMNYNGDCSSYDAICDHIYYYNNYYYEYCMSRYVGLTVRPVVGGADSNIVNYTVTVSGTTGGQVAILGYSGNSYAVEAGRQVTVVATPNDNCEFLGWIDGDGFVVSTDAEYTFMVTGNVSLVAKFELITDYKGHEYVDLGLPSGIKWATCNVGATKPEEHGGYYAWGETEEKSDYDWSSYKWCKGGSTSMTKYCTTGSYGTVDNKTVLDLEDDAANVNWGGSWRVPTKSELDELRGNCTWEWITLNGINGYRVTSKTNGNSIFLPAAGCRNGTVTYDINSEGYYWTSTLGNEYGYNVYCLRFNGSGYDWSYTNRNYGHTVRPVSK